MLEVHDTGHWAYLKRDGVTLLRVTLDADSIEGKRAPDAEDRVALLAKLAGLLEIYGHFEALCVIPVERIRRCATLQP